MEWLLCYLAAGRPLDSEDWPYVEAVPEPEPRPDWPELRWTQGLVPGEICLTKPGGGASKYSREEMLKCLESWRKSRAAYPGWMICPGKKRARIWSTFGADGMCGLGRCADTLTNSLETLSTAEQLGTLREILWRFDLCLKPMSESLKDAATRVLSETNPFAEGDASNNPPFCQAEHADWEQDWIYLAFRMLRNAREGFDGTEFCHWRELLHTVIAASSGWIWQWHYEVCLEALDRLDVVLLRASLKEWVDRDIPPAWLIRKASLLAEIGELDEAQRLARNALSQIRAQQHSSDDLTRLMSEEAWAMVLLETIVGGDRASGAKDWNEHAQLQREHRGRLRHLSPYFCDPWPEIEGLRNAVAGPKTHIAEERKRGFDPWIYSTTYHLRVASQEDEVAVSAYSLARMHEDGGFPVRAGSLLTDAAATGNMTRLLFIVKPSLAVSIAVRLGATDSLDFLDRVKVALLPASDVDALFNCVQHAIPQANKDATGDKERLPAPTKHLPRNILRGGLELLSRLAFRLRPEQRARALQLAICLYEDPGFQSNFALHSVLGNLFSRLLYAMDDDEMVQHLPSLACLSVPGESGSRVAIPDRWPEPCSYAETGDGSSAKHACLSDSVVDRLIVSLGGSNIEGRSHALRRLLSFRDMGVLTLGHLKDCSRALWAEVDEKTLLPKLSYQLSLSVILAFPQTDRREHLILKKHLLERAIPGTDLERSVKRVVRRFPSPLMDSAGGFLDLLYSCFRLPWLPRRQRGETAYLKLTESEVVKLTKRSLIFWDNEKYDLSATKHISKFMGDPHRDTKDLFERFARVLFLQLVPRLPKSTTRFTKALDTVYQEMSAEEIPVLFALPVLITLGTVSEESAVSQIKAGLLSADEMRVYNATDSVYVWAALAVNGATGLSPVPDELIQEMVGFAAARRQPGLRFVLSRLAYILLHASESISDRHRTRLCSALDDIWEEVQLPATLREYYEEETLTNRSISSFEKIEYQVMATRLASALHRDYRAAKMEIPASLEKWKRLSESTCLPEVRRAWTT